MFLVHQKKSGQSGHVVVVVLFIAIAVVVASVVVVVVDIGSMHALILTTQGNILYIKLTQSKVFIGNMLYIKLTQTKVM